MYRPAPHPPPLRILLVDNHDSYTYNLYHLLSVANAGTPPTVVPADAYPSLAALLAALGPFDAHVVSPGPGTPHSAADLAPVAAAALADPATPALGVCLGHQALCAAAGARVVRAPAGPVHGRLSRLRVAAPCPLLDGLPPAGAAVVRYHSLVVDPETLPDDLVPTAWCDDGPERVPVLMAVRHARRPLYGVQFHPESVLTECGWRIAANFVHLARAYRDNTRAQLSAVVAAPAAGRACPARAPHPPPLRPPPPESLRVLHRHVPAVRADSAAVFSALFGTAAEAFWLDSSSSATSPSLSRCSSSELPPSGDAPPPDAQSAAPPTAALALRGRFSLMGDLAGPRSELVTYSLPEGVVRVRRGGGGGGGGGGGDGASTVTRPDCELRNVSIFDYLESQLALRRVALAGNGAAGGVPLEMNGGYVGFCGYEAKADVHGVGASAHQSKLPDAWFAFADRLVVYDHSDRSVYMVAVVGAASPGEEARAQDWFGRTEATVFALAPAVSTAPGVSAAAVAADASASAPAAVAGPARPSPRAPLPSPFSFVLERDRAAYEGDVSRCLEYIAAGESYEICLTNRLRAELPAATDVLGVYLTLRLVNPAPYAAFLRLGRDTAVCCSSPERFLRASADGTVESKPIKGTRPRGSSVEEDAALSRDLRTSEKDRSENLMIVDLVRNDLGRTCAVGSITVPALMRVETYASVHQLVSTVRGRRRDGVSTVRCIREAYPMGSMTGAPKVRTLSLIDGLESSARGVYSGTIGYLSLCGAADMNVVIRTAVVRSGTVEIGVGGAVVALSSPEEEFAEILVKGRPIMQAIALAVTGSSTFVVQESSSPSAASATHVPPDA